ncbi:hypothetical protein [Devosia beringensis]|uniref:hypothetical protein n=1 Tax=Devosia beringensis TaxID=2657486 RepID=UPI00186B9ED9|nr:hypothetical protein [Devosia beringensis]
MIATMSSWRTLDPLPSFMPGIAPVTDGDAAVFAERYLEPARRPDFMADHRGGDTLARWWPRLDSDTRHMIFVDCMLSDGAVPYDQRLEAVDRNPRRNAFLTEE